MLLLMCDLPLLLHALFSVCFNNCLGFTLIPEALNKENWLGEFLEAVHQCLQEVESEYDARAEPNACCSRGIAETQKALYFSEVCVDKRP